MQIYKILMVVVILTLLVSPILNINPVLAQNNSSGWQEYNGDLPADSGNPGAAKFESLEAIFSNILGLVVPLAGIIIFIMFVIGGYRLMFAGGDPQKMTLAQGTLTWAVIGLLLLLGSWFILSLIASFTGVDALKTFKVIIFPWNN